MTQGGDRPPQPRSVSAGDPPSSGSAAPPHLDSGTATSLPPAPGRANDRMPPWLPRAIVLSLVGVAALLLGYWLLLRLRSLLVILLVSLFASVAIEPAVNALARRGWRRGAATLAVFAAVAIVSLAFVGVIGSLLVGQVASLVDTLPGYVEQATEFLNRHFHTNLSAGTLAHELAQADSPLRRFATGLAGNALGLGTALLTLLFQALTVLLFTFYLAADGPRFRRAVCSLLPAPQQRAVLRAWDIAVEETGGYVYSRALLAGVSAVMHGLFLWLIGVPYPVALGLWVGAVSQLVPTVGTYLAGALPLLVALLSDPLDALWVLLFVAAYQQLENYLLAPRLTARTMALHPAVAFGSVIAGASILGGVGALLALPVSATLQAFASTYLHRHELVDEALDTNLDPVPPASR
jgi:predicted PurR-regulated permease PerM